MKVLIADDNPIVLMGLRVVLERVDGVTEVLEARDGVDALEQAASSAPDIVSLDVRMPRKDGLQVLADLPRVCAPGPVPPALMLTHSEEPDIVRLAMDRGARGYLVHGHATREEIASALHTCVSGGLVLSGPAFRAMTEPSAAVPDGDHPFAAILTERETDVLRAAAEGHDNVTISRAQYLSPRTVKNYLNSAYVKLGVHSRAEAVAAWHEAAAGQGRPEGRLALQAGAP